MSAQERSRPEKEAKVFLYKELFDAFMLQKKYDLNGALGLVEDRDRRGVRLFLAQIRLRESIRELNDAVNNPQYMHSHLYWGGIDALGDQLQKERLKQEEIEVRIVRHKEEYSSDSNRPYHLRNAVNHIWTQSADSKKKVDRKYIKSLAADWKQRLAESQ